MKKNILFSIVLTFISGVVWSGVSASKEPSVKVFQIGNIVKVIFDNAVSNRPVKISITDEHGKPIFTETINRKRGFIRPYNFSNLEEGTYWITVLSDQNKAVEKVEYIVPSKKEKQLLAHVTRYRKNQYLLSVPNMNQSEMEISILDADNQILYQHSKKNIGAFSVLYIVKNQNDDIVVHLKDKNEGTEKSFRFSPD